MLVTLYSVQMNSQRQSRGLKFGGIISTFNILTFAPIVFVIVFILLGAKFYAAMYTPSSIRFTCMLRRMGRSLFFSYLKDDPGHVEFVQVGATELKREKSTGPGFCYPDGGYPHSG